MDIGIMDMAWSLIAITIWIINFLMGFGLLIAGAMQPYSSGSKLTSTLVGAISVGIGFWFFADFIKTSNPKPFLISGILTLIGMLLGLAIGLKLEGGFLYGDGD